MKKMLIVLVAVVVLSLVGCPKRQDVEVQDADSRAQHHRYIVYWSGGHYHCRFRTDSFSIEPVTRMLTATVEVLYEPMGDMSLGSTVKLTPPYAIIDRGIVEAPEAAR